MTVVEACEGKSIRVIVKADEGYTLLVLDGKDSILLSGCTSLEDVKAFANSPVEVKDGKAVAFRVFTTKTLFGL